MNLRVCTWNFGSHRDFQRTHPDFENASDETLRLHRAKLFDAAFRSSAMASVGVYLLQEVHAADWPIPTLALALPLRFDMFDDYDGRDRDTTVAWDADLFDCIERFRISSRDKMWSSAVVHLKCRQTGVRLVICSVHLIGFNHAAAECTRAEQAVAGDDQLREILDALDKYCVQQTDGSFIIVGGDFNADDRYYDRRHWIVNDRGEYWLVSPFDVPTFHDLNLNCPVTLDYIFVRAAKTVVSTHVQGPFLLTDVALGADHLPVIVDVSLPFPTKKFSVCTII